MPTASSTSSTIETRAAEYYRRPGRLTDMAGRPADAFAELPEDPQALCQVVQRLIVHEYLAPRYGRHLSDAAVQQVRTRSAADMVDLILELDPAPLVEPRPPEQRMVGNCRHFATLTTALLRRGGTPARARCGFAAYFDPGRMVDHWVTEYASAGRWVRVDSQIDQLQRDAFDLAFDPQDMPAEPFLAAAEGWRRCREGQDAAARYGILEMWGAWFIAGNVVRDLAALNKMELLPWDCWGPMVIGVDPDSEQAAVIDTVAATVLSGDLAGIQDLYRGTDLAVPDTVFDGRFGGPRWITFGHIESDECGSMNEWLAAAPHAEVAHGATGCLVSINDLADRPPRMLADGEVLDLGGKQVRHLDTPHVPHNWEARVLFEESTNTLLCGDLFTHLGDGPAVTESDLVGPAIDAEKVFLATSLGQATSPTMRRLAALEPTTLAVMHGSSFHGDGAAALNELADAYEATFLTGP